MPAQVQPSDSRPSSACGEQAPALTIVVAGVIRNDHGQVLLARRPAGVHMAGLWELPGGKVDDGEAPAAALVRELREELGIETMTGPPITFAVHEEPGRRILLLFYASSIVSGTPSGLEGQDLAWVPPAELLAYPTPPADAGLIRQLAGWTIG